MKLEITVLHENGTIVGKCTGDIASGYSLTTQPITTPIVSDDGRYEIVRIHVDTFTRPRADAKP